MALRLNSAGHIFQAKNNVIKKAEGVRTVHFRLLSLRTDSGGRIRRHYDKIHDQKIYYNHSDYVGGVRETTLREMMAKKPEKVVELAVKGMLPKGPLGRSMINKLHVYAGPDHEQAAQKPEVLTF